MFKNSWILLLFLPLASLAQITSTFDTDADGWTYLSNSTSISVSHQASGGNPGAFVSVTYSANAGATTQNWIAPAKFLGNQLVRSLGMTLGFDLQQSQAGTTGGYDVRIENGGNYINFSLAPKPAVAPAWSSYSIILDETAGWKWNGSATNATRAQIKSILVNITSIEIRGAYATNASYTSGLDNVILEQRSLLTAPTITSFLPASANPGTTITINGGDFDATPANNAVYFGSIAGLITSASTTQLSVTVPVGATYGPITIVNKTSGLSQLTQTPFIPTFSGGGRIIPASFDPKTDIILSANVEGVSTADIDGDGWNDLLISSGSNTVLVYHNLSTGGDITTGSFASPVNLPNAGNTNGLFTRDVDGDGKVDIIAGYTSGTVVNFATYRNTSTPGNLSFDAVEYWSGAAYSGSISNIADVDGDGRVDLIGQHGNGSVNVDFWIVQNISTPGDIEFGPSVSYFGGSTLDAGSGVGVGDLDNDGKPDFLVSHSFGGIISIVKNNSTPGTISLTHVGTISSGNSGLTVVDLNVDGKNDIVWKNGSTIRIRLNTNSGGPLDITDFTTEVSLVGDLSNYGGMSIGDLNGDGKPDIAATDNGDVGVFENVYSGGVFDASSFVSAYELQGNGTSTYPTSPTVADLNGDNKPELIMGVTNTTPNRISIYENKNVHTPVISINTVSPLKGAVGSTVTITGSYFSPVTTDNHVTFGGVEATVLTASLTLLTVSVPAGITYAPVSVRVGELSSRYRVPFITTFSSGVTFDNTHFAPPVNFTLTAANYDIEVGDLNLDGKPDILAEANGGYAFLNAYSSGNINVSTLVPDDTLSVGSFVNPRIEDFDGDGLLDAVSVNGPAHRNTSTASEISFQPSVSLGLGGSTLDMADFNNDGKTDFAVTVDLSGIGDLVIRENRSRVGSFTTGTFGSFSGNIVFNKPAAGGGITTEDFDGDGFADVATTNPLSDNISVYLNAGILKISNAQFALRTDFATGDNPGRIYKGDFDADGKTDLMLYHAGTNTTLLTVFHNTSTVGNISFTRIDLTNPSATTVASIADLDGDGKPEIITTSESGNRFSIFKNIHTTGALTAASFAAPFNTTVTAPRGITTGDLNLDGKPEIILTRAAGLLVVYENLVPTVAITITQQPASPNYACEGGTASFTTAASGTTNITYQWQKFDGSVFVDLVNSTTFSGVTTPTLTISNVSSSESGDYQCVISGDFAADVITSVGNLVFNSLPTPPDVVNGISCGPGIVTLTASGGSPGDYRWYSGSPLTLIAGEQDETFVTPSLSANTTYHVAVRSTFCESVPVAVTAIISTVPAQPAITSSITPVGNALTICTGTPLTLAAPNGFASYLWSDGSSAQQLSVSASGTYSVSVINANGCASPDSDGIVITVQANPCSNSAPVITTTSASTTLGSSVSIDLSTLISDADNNLVLSSLTVSQPMSGAVASLNGTSLSINYSGNPFTGTEVISIQVCDVFGECVSQTFEIKVIGEIEIFNAVSPNGDGKNDFFKIAFIEDLEPENTVSIYNRWGSKVYETKNYSDANSFKGLNQNGNELPSGTYFYKISFKSTGKTQTGYLVLKR